MTSCPTRFGERHAWRLTAGVLAVLCLALLVAAAIKRDPPDFSALPIIAVVSDHGERPVWAIRLSRPAHEISADSLRPQPAPPGRAYQLWLAAPDGAAPHWLGLLPVAGRKEIPVVPAIVRLLLGTGELIVTVEPAGGSPAAEPTGPEVFRGTLEASG
ncbi:MAG: anti-sigma factor [Alphaproteobacteria bacterium]|nr:anti-sigma factor [Alphaproteobacteria bacterium]